MTDGNRNSLGEVMLPEISEDAHLRMTIDGLEALEVAYGDEYMQHCFDRLDTMTISVVKAVAGHSVQRCTVEQLLTALRISEASKRLADALSISVSGRDVAEELQHRQAKDLAWMEKLKAIREAAEANANA